MRCGDFSIGLLSLAYELGRSHSLAINIESPDHSCQRLNSLRELVQARPTGENSPKCLAQRSVYTTKRALSAEPLCFRSSKGAGNRMHRFYPCIICSAHREPLRHPNRNCALESSMSSPKQLPCLYVTPNSRKAVCDFICSRCICGAAYVAFAVTIGSCASCG